MQPPAPGANWWHLEVPTSAAINCLVANHSYMSCLHFSTHKVWREGNVHSEAKGEKKSHSNPSSLWKQPHLSRHYGRYKSRLFPLILSKRILAMFSFVYSSGSLFLHKADLPTIKHLASVPASMFCLWLRYDPSVWPDNRRRWRWEANKCLWNHS